MSIAVSIQKLAKRYGKTQALANVSLEIPAGAAYALLGKNGAGKTTLLNCTLGLTSPNAGTVLFNGETLQWHMFEHIAYVPDGCALYDALTIAQHVAMFAGQVRSFDCDYADRILKRFELPVARRMGALSRGQKAAAAVTVAFASRPQLVLLDEPTAGLDPGAQRIALDLVVEAAACGATVLLSSHNVAHIERVADHVAILRSGVIALDGPLDELLSRHRVIEAIAPNGVALPTLDAVAPEAIERIGTMVRVFSSDADRTRAQLVGAGFDIAKMTDSSLEDVYFAHAGASPAERH